MSASTQRGMDDLATAALHRFGLAADAAAELCNVSENHTYRVDVPSTGRRYALRIHRPGYRTAAQIACELRWVAALRSDGTVDTAVPVPAPGGELVVEVTSPGFGTRHVVLFEWLDGSTPDPEGHEFIAAFHTLGAVSARMHAHARRWPRGSGFDRPTWDFEHTLGSAGHWGRWQDGLGLGRDERALLERLCAVIAARLRVYGQGKDRFGLVHADMRLANLLVDGDHVQVIDFDDCGFSWFMYDFATAVSFIEDDPRLNEMRDAWVEGYRTVGALEKADVDELDTLVMLRRLLLVAWVGSHHTFASEAADLGADFTVGTCTLAERYLSTHV